MAAGCTVSLAAPGLRCCNMDGLERGGVMDRRWPLPDKDVGSHSRVPQIFLAQSIQDFTSLVVCHGTNRSLIGPKRTLVVGG